MIEGKISKKIWRWRRRRCEDRLARDFNSLSGILDSLPLAIDAVLEPTGSAGLKLYRRMRAEKELRSKVAVFDEAASKFHQGVGRMRAVSSSDSALLTAQDLRLIGSSGLKQVSEAISTAKASHVAPGQTQATDREVLIESKPYTDSTKKEAERDIRDIATKLSRALAHWNVPHLIGYRLDAAGEAVDLVYDRPQPGCELIILAKIYAADTPTPSLNVRIRLCSQLAIAVLQAHRLDLVHKHIRPDNPLIAPKREGQDAITDASLYLAGWQNARIIHGTATARLGDSSVHKSLYQHPDRQLKEGQAKENYNIGHDIYSLGVCMLELLTWEVLFRPGKTLHDPPTLSHAYVHALENLDFHAGIEMSEEDDVSKAELYTKDALNVQETLVSVAKERVPQSAGDTMANLVRKCLLNTLTSAEVGNDLIEEFDSEIFDEFNKLLAVL